MTDDINGPAADGIAGRRAAVVSCGLCGISLHKNQMVPDGGAACADVRWYCKDAQECTERWTSSGRLVPPAEVA